MAGISSHIKPLTNMKMKTTPAVSLFLGMLSFASLPILNAEPPKTQTTDTPNRAAPDAADKATPPAGTASKATKTESPKTTGESPNRTAPDKPAKQTMNEADILTCLKGVNEHEIAAANVAEKKKVSAPVLDYAKMMEKEHTKNLAATNKLLSKTEGQPAHAAKHAEKKAEGEKDLAKLSEKDGDVFGKAYISAMVKGHKEVLDELDSKLIPAAQTEAVKKHLTETRTHVAHHLEEAQKIQAAMK